MDKAGRLDRDCGKRAADSEGSVRNSRCDTGPIPVRANEVRGGVTP